MKNLRKKLMFRRGSASTLNLSKKLIFIKLGGSLITKKKPYTADFKKIKEIAKEIHFLRKKMGFKLLIGNGGGSFPHISAKKYRTAEGLINKNSIRGISIVSNDASKINKIVVNELIKVGENAVSVQPSAIFLAKKGGMKSVYIEPIKMYLKYDMTPVVYGDVIMDEKRGCTIFSTEKIFDYLTKKLKPQKIILMADVEGVYDFQKRIIPEINKKNFSKIEKFLKGADKIDVTGGMLHKVKEAIDMSKGGAKINIIGGKRGNLEKCLKDKKVGTKIENF